MATAAPRTTPAQRTTRAPPTRPESTRARTTRAPTTRARTTPAPTTRASTTGAPPTRAPTTRAPTRPATTRATTRPPTTRPRRTEPDPSDKCAGHRSVRPDITTISNRQWDDYVEAVRLLREKPGENGVSVWENFAQYHADHGMHFGAYFAPWHRAMMFRLEQELDSVKPGVRIPFYDWSMNNLNALRTPVFGPTRLGGSESFDGNHVAPIPNGPFQEFSSRVPGGSEYVMRNFDERIFLHSRSSIDVAIASITEYSQFAVYLEGVHNSFHVQIGGTMNNLAHSPGDPAFYIHHCFIDKIWREWQQIGNSNKFGRHPAVDGNPINLDEVMHPFGLTVREVLEDISGCVEYTDASSRPDFTFPDSTRQGGNPADRQGIAFPSSFRQDNETTSQGQGGHSGENSGSGNDNDDGNKDGGEGDGDGGDGAQDRAGRKVAPKQTEAAGKYSAFVDDTEEVKEPKLKDKEEKRKVQRKVAEKKEQDPAGYRTSVLNENKAVTDCVGAAAKLGAPKPLQNVLRKVLAYVEFKEGVDLTDVNDVYEESPEEIAEDGRKEKEAIDNKDDNALKENKRDVDGTASDVSVGVENKDD